MVSSETSTHAPEGYTPTHVRSLEIGQPLPIIPIAERADGQRYRRIRLLVLLHSCPLGVVDIDADTQALHPIQYAPTIWSQRHAQILAHLECDGLPSINGLGPEGAPVATECAYSAAERRIAADAPLVSVVICTRDRPEALSRTLGAVVGQAYSHVEVLVVDNAPQTSATAELVRTQYAQHTNVRYVLEPRPGLSVARNRGVREARGSIVAFTDDDTIPAQHWLSSLVGGFEATQGVACVTGLTFPFQLDTPPQFWFEEYGGFNKGYQRRIFRLHNRSATLPLHPYTAGQFGTGANMAFRADFLREMGGFDVALGAGSPSGGGEDLDAFFQALARNHALVYEPRALVFHEHRRDYSALRQQLYGAGKGLTAYLTKVLAQDVRRVGDVAVRLPYGVYFTLNPRSPKNQRRSHTYPKELARLELRGMLEGPAAYARGRVMARHERGGAARQVAEGDSSSALAPPATKDS